MALGKKVTVDAVDVYPIADYILVVPEEPKTQTSGGILLPEGTNDRLRVGYVVRVGPGRVDPNTMKNIPMQTKEGMRVIYDPAYHMLLEIGEHKFVLVREPECRAALGPKAAEYVTGSETYRSNPTLCPVERNTAPKKA